jgi:hypothetical protein
MKIMMMMTFDLVIRHDFDLYAHDQPQLPNKTSVHWLSWVQRFFHNLSSKHKNFLLCMFRYVCVCRCGLYRSWPMLVSHNRVKYCDAF